MKHTVRAPYFLYFALVVTKQYVSLRQTERLCKKKNCLTFVKQKAHLSKCVSVSSELMQLI